MKRQIREWDATGIIWNEIIHSYSQNLHTIFVYKSFGLLGSNCTLNDHFFLELFLNFTENSYVNCDF